MATANSSKEEVFDTIIENVLALCNLKKDDYTIVTSGIHNTFSTLDKCMIEVKTAYVAAAALKKKALKYNGIGSMKFLIPALNNMHVRDFMFTYLEPILQNEELMQTVITCVLSGGDYEVTAGKLFIHRKTLRYRSNKVSELLSPGKNFNEFYSDLSNAVKLYLASGINAETEDESL